MTAPLEGRGMGTGFSSSRDGKIREPSLFAGEEIFPFFLPVKIVGPERRFPYYLMKGGTY